MCTVLHGTFLPHLKKFGDYLCLCTHLASHEHNIGYTTQYISHYECASFKVIMMLVILSTTGWLGRNFLEPFKKYWYESTLRICWLTERLSHPIMNARNASTNVKKLSISGSKKKTVSNREGWCKQSPKNVYPYYSPPLAPKLTRSVELLATGDVKDLAVDPDTHPTVLPRAVVLLQLL